MCDMTAVSLESCHSNLFLIDSCHTYEFSPNRLIAPQCTALPCHMTNSYVWHDSFTRVTASFILMCDMTYAYVWHGPFLCVTWLVFMCVTWLIHTRDINHSYVRDMTHCYGWHDVHTCDMTMTNSRVWHALCIRVTWLIHTCGTCHILMRVSFLFLCVVLLIHMWAMTQSYVWHDSFHLHAPLSVSRNEFMNMRDTTCSCAWHDSFIRVICLTHMSDMTPSTPERANEASGGRLAHTATHCNTLKHIATHCNTLQHTATYCNTRGVAFRMF